MPWQYATFNKADADAIRAIGTPLAEFVVDIQATLDEYAKAETALAGFDLPDPITIAIAIDPTIGEYKTYHVKQCNSYQLSQ